MSTPLLEVDDLSVRFTRHGQEPFTAVDKVTFNVAPGEVFRHPVVSRKNQSEAASAKW